MFRNPPSPLDRTVVHTYSKGRMSDFQNFVRHAEFGKILQLNDRLKHEERMMKEEEEEPSRLVRFSTAPSMKPRKKMRWLTSSDGGNTLLSTTSEDDDHVTTFNTIDPGSSSYDGAAELVRKTLLVPSPNDGSSSYFCGKTGRKPSDGFSH